MQALVLREKGQPLHYGEWPDPEPGSGEVVVELKAAALNHRDVFITQGLYPGIETPIILGSDGAGLLNGREVVLNPSIGWGPDPDIQARSYRILGLPDPGTFAQKVALPETQIYDKPAHLSWEEAAALPLAGLTAYRALFTKGQVAPGQKVLISGVGGGVALFAFQFALAAEAEVYVTSGSEEKLARARDMGAAGGVNYKNPDWGKVLQSEAGAFQLVIDSAGGEGFKTLLKLCAPAARLVTYGGTQGAVPKFLPQHIFWKQLSILGTSMGNDREFADMLKLVADRQIHPVVDSTYTLEQGAAAFERMDQGLQFGKIVLQIPG